MLVGLLLSTLLSVPPAGASGVAALYDQVSPAVVGISCRRGPQERYFGTGTIIDPGGLVITSITVVPLEARQIRVYLRGSRVVPARAVLVDAAREVALVKIEADDEDFPSVPLGDSRAVRVGQVALTLGNAFQSIETDDQVSLGEGIVSGIYDLAEGASESKYVGPAIETSAHLNSGMDGGPLIDSSGRLIGILSLNYSKTRWLGTAVPIHEVKPLLSPHKGWFNDRDETFAAYLGLELVEVRGKEVVVLEVHPDGPAWAAGITAGERIEGLESLARFREAFASRAPGAALALECRKDGQSRTVQLQLWGRY